LLDGLAIGVDAEALLSTTVFVVVVGASSEALTLGAVARAVHHVLAEATALLDGGFQILVRLLLDGLRIL